MTAPLDLPALVALRALVSAFPTCSLCPRPATRAWTRGEARWCDVHGEPAHVPEYPRAQALRDAIACLEAPPGDSADLSALAALEAAASIADEHAAGFRRFEHESIANALDTVARTIRAKAGERAAEMLAELTRLRAFHERVVGNVQLWDMEVAMDEITRAVAEMYDAQEDGR